MIFISDKKYTVYKHTSPEGKVYIGATRNPVNRRWQNGHGYRCNKPLFRDINEFGWDNFNHDIIASGLTEDEAYKLETELIAKYNSTNAHKGYNVSIGGKGAMGVIPSDETRKKIGDAERGEKHHYYGKHLTEEHRRKMSEAALGRKLSDETKRKLSESHRGEKHNFYGKHFSEEHRRHISESRKGEKHHYYGKCLTDEHRRKIGISCQKRVICLDTGIIYDSLNDAALKNDISPSMISSACHGRIKTAGKQHWAFYYN